jgi:hypothetical protein
MAEQPQGIANKGFGRLTPPPKPHAENSFTISPPPSPYSTSSERALKLIEQLQEKTELGKLTWTTGFEDGQFKTVLPRGELAFVAQVKGNVRRFLVLDERQEVILEETITDDEALDEQLLSPKDRVFDAIGKLQAVARVRALQVNEKQAKAERLLAAI